MTREDGYYKYSENYKCVNCGSGEVKNFGEEEEGYFTFGCYECGSKWSEEIEENEEE